jgi:hypothetical protein
LRRGEAEKLCYAPPRGVGEAKPQRGVKR